MRQEAYRRMDILGLVAIGVIFSTLDGFRGQCHRDSNFLSKELTFLFSGSFYLFCIRDYREARILALGEKVR